MSLRTNTTLIAFAVSAAIGGFRASAQALPTLTLQEAEALAIQNHPQIQAAQNEINYSNQQIIEDRSVYYPNVTGNLTGSQGNTDSRIGAGDLSASRLFNRFGQGVVVRQLITDSGRTSNLVKQLAPAGAGSDAECASHAL